MNRLLLLHRPSRCAAFPSGCSSTHLLAGSAHGSSTRAPPHLHLRHYCFLCQPPTVPGDVPMLHLRPFLVYCCVLFRPLTALWDAPLRHPRPLLRSNDQSSIPLKLSHHQTLAEWSVTPHCCSGHRYKPERDWFKKLHRLFSSNYFLD